MRMTFALVLVVAGGATAFGQGRAAPPAGVTVDAAAPKVEAMQTETVLPASACRLRLSPELAQAPSVAPRAGPGGCGGEDLVRLEAVMLPQGRRLALSPPAVLRCGMAEALVEWVREAAAPAAAGLGAPVAAIDNFSAYQCRGRNNVAGAKLSEHGLANAFDLRGFRLADGRTVDLTDVHLDRGLRERLRDSVCSRFSTVLGPGADRYHENHIHLDLAQRRRGYRMCQWEVRDPAPAVASVPLPPRRPDAAAGRPPALDANGVAVARAVSSAPVAKAAKAAKAEPRRHTDAAGNAVRPAAARSAAPPPVADAAGNPAVRTASESRTAARGRGRVVDPAGNRVERARPDRRAGG